MAIIGNFTRDGENFTGTIATLVLKAEATIQLIEKVSASAPDYRVYVAGAEAGAAWINRSKGERPYLTVKLDDPSFTAAIYCRLVEADGEKHQLLWSR